MALGLDDHFKRYVLPIVLVELVLFAYAELSDVRTCQVVIGLLGLWWCLAALWVEVKIEHAYPHFQYDNPTDPEMKAYKPFCDFAPWATCSKVLMSPPGRFLLYFGVAKDTTNEASPSTIDRVRGWINVPNPTLGVFFFGAHLFYPVLLIVPFVNVIIPWAFLAACCFVGCMTIWLAYNLFFKLKDFCIVCVSMYVANFAVIPMMYNICSMNMINLDDWKFFGSVPPLLLYPFLALDIVMCMSVLVLYLFCHPGHKEAQEEGSYSKIPDTAEGA